MFLEGLDGVRDPCNPIRVTPIIPVRDEEGEEQDEEDEEEDEVEDEVEVAG